MAGNFFIDGILHITDIEGYDHMLFLTALCAPFTFRDWRPVLLLATAFTVGHSISLALAALDILRFSSSLIEFCIPLTIAGTSLYHIWKQSKEVTIFSYGSAALFGVIHGMGFSSFFRMIAGEDEGFIGQLFLFNLGVECGQLLILTAVLGIIAILTSALPPLKNRMTYFIAGPALIISIVLAIEKWPF